MRRKLDWLLLLLALGAAAYVTYTRRTELRLFAHKIRLKAAPCSEAVTYAIGSVDERFGISTATLAGELKEAGAVWNGPARRTLFDYAPGAADVTINLVYDKRQAAADTLKAAGIQTNQSRESYSDLKNRYDALSARVDSEQLAHDRRVAAYKRAAGEYNSEVARWNRAGQAPPAARRRMLAGQASLTHAFAAVKAFERELNADIDTLNALATALNQLIVQLNLDVAQYNRTGAEMGVFEQGLYSRVNGVQTIDIYEYSNRTQLVRVLAHELGHALGLDHVSEAGAIMYKMNQGDSLAAAPADLAEVNRACNGK